jgi:serine/threonine protein kinase
VDPEADTDPKAEASTESLGRGKEYFRTVARLGAQAAEALDHAHQAGIVHRDVKPANLMLDSTGRLWVTDFGLAQLQAEANLTTTGDGNLTMSGDLLGTLRYMSPEQALAQRVVVDHRTDIYSLGATLYELLTLRPLVSGEDRQQILHAIAFDEPTAPRRIDRSIPAELETVVLKALAKNPAERYATAQEMANDLHRFLRNQPIQARRPSLAQRARKWARRHRPLVRVAMASVGFALVGLAIANVFTWMALRDRDDALHRMEWSNYELERQYEHALERRKDAIQKRIALPRSWPS